MSRRPARRPRPLVRSLFLVLALVILHPASPASADLPSTSLPLKFEGPSLTTFAGDRVVVVTTSKKGGELIGHFTAFGLSDLKEIWSVDQSLGRADVEVGTRVVPDGANGVWYLGTGPFSLLDLSAGKIEWTIPCDKIGFVNLDQLRFLPGDRAIVLGTKKCDPGSEYDALKEPVFTMIDTKGGSVLWSHATKSYEYELGLGFWARVAKYQGRRVSKEKRIQIEAMFASPSGGDYEFPGSKADRLVIIGERLEAVSLADGSPLYKTKDKVGILRGAYGGKIFCREGDDLTAYESGTGQTAWTFDLRKKGGRVYTADDLVDMGHGVPEGMTDLMISESDVVSRVSTATGKAAFTVKRNGMAWQATPAVLLTKDGDKTTAYDWNTGAKKWEVKAGKRPFAYAAGQDLVFVEGDERSEEGKPLAPFKVAVVNAQTGQIVWSRKDLNGKKISKYEIDPAGWVRLRSEDQAVVTLNIADGSAASEPIAAGETGNGGAGYSLDFYDKGVRCRDASGKVIWERKGEKFFPPDGQPKYGMAIFPTADGQVEVIGMADGVTKWKAKGEKETEVRFSPDGNYLVVPAKKAVTLVRLAP